MYTVSVQDDLLTLVAAAAEKTAFVQYTWLLDVILSPRRRVLPRVKAVTSGCPNQHPA
jgi:hypothetical protein